MSACDDSLVAGDKCTELLNFKSVDLCRWRTVFLISLARYKSLQMGQRRIFSLRLAQKRHNLIYNFRRINTRPGVTE